MYDKSKNIIESLEDKVLSIVNTNIALLSQGYLINKTKYIRADWSSLLIHAFENIDVLSKDRQNKIEQLYNKVMMI